MLSRLLRSSESKAANRWKISLFGIRFGSRQISMTSSSIPIGYGSTSRFVKEPANAKEREYLARLHSNENIESIKRYVANQNWYYNHRDELIEQYEGKWIVIDDEKVITWNVDYVSAAAGGSDGVFVVYCGMFLR